MGIMLFNKLPHQVQEYDLKKFKMAIKKYFFNEVFYCVQEFLDKDIVYEQFL